MEGAEFMKKLSRELEKEIVGKREVVELLAIALLSEGHVLLEGVPGVAKTTIAKAFAKAIGLTFSRIQLTPDLLPADITGIVYYDQMSGQWKTRKGPIFANVVLADEINRAQPKTQSALLEAMQEKQVTIEGKTYALPNPFMVVATMNPLEHEGVYPLPEAQLDRFLLKIEIGFPNEKEEIELLKRKSQSAFSEARPVISKEELLDLISEARKVRVSDEVIRYIYSLVSATRTDERILFGASPRAGEHLLYASMARAFLSGRDYVIPDDVKFVTIPVLSHRIIIKAEYELEGVKAKEVLREILRETPVPV